MVRILKEVYHERLYTAVCVGLIILLAGAFCLAQDFSEIEAILARVDAQTSFDTDFSAVMTMIVEDPEQGIAKMVVRQFRRDAGDHFLLLIQEPVTEKGQGYLLEGGIIFGFTIPPAVNLPILL